MADPSGSRENTRRNWAFISYSWADKEIARTLHRRLERFAIPRSVRPALRDEGPSTKRLRPVFRDDDEMSASGVLEDRLREAIDSSVALVLLASQDSAASRYVNDEVDYFVSTRGTDRLVILNVGAESDRPPSLPPALEEEGGELLWVDCKAGRRLDRRNLVRIAAAVLGLDFDQLWRRHRRRQQKIAGAVALSCIVLSSIFGAMWWKQRDSAVRSPERQLAAFEDYLSSYLLEQNREAFPDIDPEQVRFQILRADDLNKDGLIDYFVSNESPAFCGSGGCWLSVYMTKSVGEYETVLDLLGSSTPMVRDRPDQPKDIIASQYNVGREPLYSAFRLNGKTYELLHYEFCDGVIFEMCEPAIITPISEPKSVPAAPGTVVRERPDVGARPITVGAGDSGPELTNFDYLRLLGTLQDSRWLLVEVWKGSAGFIPSP